MGVVIVWNVFSCQMWFKFLKYFFQITTKKEDFEKLEMEYTQYLQSVFQNKLNESKSSDLDVSICV